jgi:hypothetical protein
MPEDPTPSIDPDRLTPVQRHRLRKQGLLPPLPVCRMSWCDKRLITEETQLRGTCDACHRAKRQRELMRERREKN